MRSFARLVSTGQLPAVATSKEARETKTVDRASGHEMWGNVTRVLPPFDPRVDFVRRLGQRLELAANTLRKGNEEKREAQRLTTLAGNRLKKLLQ